MGNKCIEVPKIGLSLDTNFILENCYPNPEDIVFISGTLIEGIGNACSDIDVYVVTNEYRRSRAIDVRRHHRVISREREIIRADDPDQDVYIIHTVVPGTSIKVDVEFKTFSEANQLFDHVDKIFDYARRNLVLLTKRLTDRDEVFIHRVLSGRSLQNRKAFTALQKGISRSRYAYVAYRWVASDFAILLDLAGAWQAGEIDRAAEIARENIINQTSGYLRLRGVTNLRRKWILTYLRDLDEALLERFLAFMYMKGVDDAASKRKYVMQALDFVDDLFEKSVPFLNSIPDVPSGEAGIELLHRDQQENCIPSSYSDWEYEYRAKAYGASRNPTRLRLTALGACEEITRAPARRRSRTPGRVGRNATRQ